MFTDKTLLMLVDVGHKAVKGHTVCRKSLILDLEVTILVEVIISPPMYFVLHTPVLSDQRHDFMRNIWVVVRYGADVIGNLYRCIRARILDLNKRAITTILHLCLDVLDLVIALDLDDRFDKGKPLTTTLDPMHVELAPINH